MDERSRVLTAACAGAAVGGIWGWRYLTSRGCRVRDQIGPTIDRVIDELRHARATGVKAKTAINEGRQLLADIMAVRQSA
jgi:hypothetical protein